MTAFDRRTAPLACRPLGDIAPAAASLGQGSAPVLPFTFTQHGPARAACQAEGAAHLPPLPGPDAALLTLCGQLGALQAEWQRLYDATSNTDELTTAADHAWHVFSRRVWPGLLATGPRDLVGQLQLLRATTPEGLKAKARALLALREAGGYCDEREDTPQLWESLIEDAAGGEWPKLGAAASTPIAPMSA